MEDFILEKFKFTRENLIANDRVVILMELLIQKGVITKEELNETIEKTITIRNQELDKEREDNPGLVMMLDMITGAMKNNKENN